MTSEFLYCLDTEINKKLASNMAHRSISFDDESRIVTDHILIEFQVGKHWPWVLSHIELDLESNILCLSWVNLAVTVIVLECAKHS